MITVDANEAVASVAHRTNDVIAINPITPSSAIALEIPVWDPDICIQCDKCVLVCPHAVIRARVSVKNTRMLAQSRPEEAIRLLEQARHDVQTRHAEYERLAGAEGHYQ